jgi:hypothetical protein
MSPYHAAAQSTALHPAQDRIAAHANPGLQLLQIDWHVDWASRARQSPIANDHPN